MTAQPLQLRAELLPNGKTWRLLEPLSIKDATHGRLQVPAGFETDFASTRPLRSVAVCALVIAMAVTVLPWQWPSHIAYLVGIAALVLYAAVVGYGKPAAALHDWLYFSGALSRQQADAVFWRALRITGHARWRAWLMWVGVRLFGAARYRSYSDS
ncbi:DUF1353 domain-containing protein [Pseudomonas sp. NyZ704]|nr:DUF1353 domain-containing protein [Pseudomonas sp. NyZ704]